jgi:hypothetical protein
MKKYHFRVKQDRNILHTTETRKGNWIGHILRRNCLLKHVIEGKIEGRIEVTGRGGRRRKQLPDDLKEKIGYCKLKAEEADRTPWRTRFGRSYGLVVRQTTQSMKHHCGHFRFSAQRTQSRRRFFLMAQQPVLDQSYTMIVRHTTPGMNPLDE